MGGGLGDESVRRRWRGSGGDGRTAHRRAVARGEGGKQGGGGRRGKANREGEREAPRGRHCVQRAHGKTLKKGVVGGGGGWCGGGGGGGWGWACRALGHQGRLIHRDCVVVFGGCCVLWFVVVGGWLCGWVCLVLFGCLGFGGLWGGWWGYEVGGGGCSLR